jgi:hypothetical protein
MAWLCKKENAFLPYKYASFHTWYVSRDQRGPRRRRREPRRKIIDDTSRGRAQKF